MYDIEKKRLPLGIENFEEMRREEYDGILRRLAIPNREIHDIFMTQIREWMQKEAKKDKVRLNTFCETVLPVM